MPAIEFERGHALAVQHWVTDLAVQAETEQFFRPYMSTGNASPVKVETKLEKDKGEKVTIGFRGKLEGYGVEGDRDIVGTSAESSLDFYDDSLFIDQLRKSVVSKGKMSEKRVSYDTTKEMKDAQAVYWAEIQDQMLMCYAAGARGIDTSYHLPTDWTGFANNSLQSPDASHQTYGGSATSSSDLDNEDKIHLQDVEKMLAIAKTVDPVLPPLKINGRNKYIWLMHTFQAYDLRTSITDNDWVNITKVTSTGLGKKAPIYEYALGEYADVLLFSHRNVVRFDDYGAGSNLEAARSLFMGVQALMIAYGSGNKRDRYSMNMETDNRGNSLVITCGLIFGISKVRFNGKDYGIIAHDTYAASPY